MKYWRHHTDLRENEQIQDYLDQCKDRTAGYGFYVTLVDVIAASMTPQKLQPYAVYPEASWRRRCDVTASRWSALIECAASAGLVNVSKVDGKVRIEVPQLVDWADDYVKKVRSRSGQTPENVPLEKSKAEQIKKKESRGEKASDQSSSLSSSSNALFEFRSRSAGQSLPEKVDQILASESFRVVCDDQGNVDLNKLARTINQRDRKSSVEPSAKMIDAVRRCVDMRKAGKSHSGR